MRLDARKGDIGWPCYDAKRCRMVPLVVWVDDADATWGEWVRDPFPNTRTHQENRITIYPSRKLVIFNEVDDDVEEQAAQALEVVA